MKVTKHVYEVMDDNDDIYFASLQLNGKEGYKALWGLYMQYPDDEFLEHCKTNTLFSDSANNVLDGIKHKVSPCHAALARKVMRRVKSKHALRAFGSARQGKSDAHNLTTIVLNINNHFDVCQVL